MDAGKNRCFTQVEERGKKKSRGEESGKELGGVRREGLSLVEICVTFPCARSRGEEGEGVARSWGFSGGAENGRGRVAKGCKISREHEQSAIPPNDSPPG